MKAMKRFKYLLLLMMGVIVGLAFSACSDDDDDPVRFKVLNPELTFEGVGGTQSLTVQSPIKPTLTITDGADICTIAEGSVEGDTYNYDVTLSANTGEEARSATIRVVAGTSRKDVTISQAVQPIDIPTGEMKHSAKELAALMYAGINIGNTMECPGNEGAWSGSKVNEEYIKGLKAAGFNAVRIPCAWDSYITDKTSFEIDAKWLDRVARVVSWCIQNDMYVVLNSHWDNGWLEDNIFDASKKDAINAEQKAIWTQIANKFKDYDEHLLFAACNEPGMNETSRKGKKWTDAEAVARVVEYEQTMIDAVRATGGNNAKRTLIVQGLGTSIAETNDYMTALPTDAVEDRLMVEVHFYEPYQFALMEEDASWGKCYYFWGKDNQVAGSDRNTPDASAEAWVDASMKKMYDKYVSKGIPCIIGEYSAMFRNLSENQDIHDKSVAYYGEYVTKVAKNNGCVPFYWETGTVINRKDGSVKKQAVVDGLMKGAQEGKYPW
mgnify:FL=1